LIGDYARPGRGLRVEKVAGGYRITTRPELADVLREFVRRRNRTRLSRAALETLAVVAYRQPVTAPEIEEIRGVNPAAILKGLLEKRFVRISGRKRVVGNPFLYETTPEFLDHFGLDRVDDLPSLEEFASLLDEAQPALPEIADPTPVDMPLEAPEGADEA
jgi:segregation and condensation protein B